MSNGPGAKMAFGIRTDTLGACASALAAIASAVAAIVALHFAANQEKIAKNK